MRQEIIAYLEQNHDLKQFVRSHPQWYRRLGRNPHQWQDLQKEADYFYGRTFPQRVEKINQSMNMVLMVMDLLRSR